MESQIHTLSSLFDQLGLDNEDSSIEHFINHHKPVPGDVELHQAEFWSRSQSDFIKQMKDEDADWVGIIDQLDVMLRQ